MLVRGEKWTQTATTAPPISGESISTSADQEHGTLLALKAHLTSSPHRATWNGLPGESSIDSSDKSALACSNSGAQWSLADAEEPAAANDADEADANDSGMRSPLASAPAYDDR